MYIINTLLLLLIVITSKSYSPSYILYSVSKNSGDYSKTKRLDQTKKLLQRHILAHLQSGTRIYRGTFKSKNIVYNERR